MLLIQLIDIYSIVVFMEVILSWLQPANNSVSNFIHTLTEPLLKPIRKALPETGGLDFSPMVLLIGLQILRNIVS